MRSRYKNHSIREIWDIMPKRFQGFVLMLLIALTIELFSVLVNVFPKHSWGSFSISIVLIIFIFWVCYYSSDWLFEEEKDEDN